MRFPGLPLLAGALLVVVPLAQAPGDGPEARRPLRHVPYALAPAGVEGLAWRLVVKFDDRLRARAGADGSLGSAAAARAHVAGQLEPVRALARRAGLRFRPLLDLSEERLSALETRAAARSGRAQPDLAGLAVAEAPTAERQALLALAEALQALDAVEFAHVEPLGVRPPGDVAPATPDLAAQQAYVGPNPGLDVAWARSLGFRGQGVRLSDCEYGWNPDHEDLVDRDLYLEPGQTIHPSVFANGWDSHGTAVVGSAAALDNGYGVSGIAELAEVHTYPEWTLEGGQRRAAAIASAIASSQPGDVVLLEMQTIGAGGGYAPAEVDPAVFSVVRAGVDAGVVVVAAAGNGNQDLDGAAYATWRGWGDSGAILVGAGSATTAHSKLSFSSYGSRLDLQGWGESVFTLGYGDFAQYGGDPNQRYTAVFDGTSSASGLVAAACAQLQSAAQATTGARLTPEVLRQLLVDTGREQTSGGSIGPLPDLRAAIERLDQLVVPLGVSSVGTGLVPALSPGTGQDLVVLGTALDTVQAVEVDGTALKAKRWSIADPTHLTIDLPQLATLGPHTLTLRSASSAVDAPFTVVAPLAPALEVGNGDGYATNQFPSAGGCPLKVGGRPGETHWVLYSSSSRPSVLPGLISLGIGAGFAELDFALALQVPPAGWSATTLPFAPTLALLFFQSFTLDQGKPYAVSNVQSALLGF